MSKISGNFPTEIYETAWDWVVSTNQNPDVYQEIHPSSVLSRTEPNTLDENVHWKLRSWRTVELPPTYVVEINQGRVWGDEGVVITPDGGVLADIARAYQRKTEDHPIFALSSPPNLVELKGTIVVVSARGGHRNYFHWLFDVLPRFHLLRSSQFAQQQIDYYILNSLQFPFQRETLQYFDIPFDRIITSEYVPYLRAERLILPSRTCIDGHVQPWTCKVLRRIFHSKPVPQGPKRIFISRRMAKRRRVVNEDVIQTFLERSGFVTVVLETMKVEDQVSLFAGADVVVAPHGAGLSNLLFCSVGTKVVEFFSPNAVTFGYWGLSHIIGLEYYYLLGQGPRPLAEDDPFLIDEDIAIDVAELTSLMKLANITN